MTDLLEFAGLPLDELMLEIERMKSVRVAKHCPSLSPLATSPDCPAESLTRVVASTMKSDPQAIPFKLWGHLSAPVDPADTLLCMRAQSILSGAELGQVHDLTLDQARDVVAWHHPKY